MFIKEELLPEAITAVNELRVWFNEAAPKLIEMAETAQIRANGVELFKTDKDKMEPILDTTPFRAFVSVSYGNIWLQADITYPTKYLDGGGYTCHYYGEILLLNNRNGEFEPYPQLSKSVVLDKMKEYKELQQKADTIQEQASAIKWELRALEIS